MKPYAIIPWRSGDPQREANRMFVAERLGQYDIPFSEVDSDPDLPFNRGAAKNAGVALAVEAADTDIVIFHDADMLLPSLDAYEAMVGTAEDTGELVIGFTDYHALTRAGTNMVLQHQIVLEQATIAQTLTAFSVGGIIAITVEALLEVGGYDERFRGWGCEDFAFLIACQTVLGPAIRMSGPAYHLWHEHGSATQQPGDEQWNGELLGRYNQITGVEDLRAVQGG